MENRKVSIAVDGLGLYIKISDQAKNPIPNAIADPRYNKPLMPERYGKILETTKSTV